MLRITEVSIIAAYLLALLAAVNGQTPPSTGLYFQLGNTIYLSGDTVPITDIGPQLSDRSDSGSTLVCVTTNVNTQCCRGKDNPNGGPLGNLFGPSGVLVPGFNSIGSAANIFYVVRYTHQLRLGSQGSPIGPLGEYTCAVRATDGNSVISAKITISSSIPTTSAMTTASSTLSTASTSLPTTTMMKTTMMSTTMEPTTMEPTTMEPTTVEPTTVEPTTMEPTTMEPTTREPTTREPTTREPSTMEPMETTIMEQTTTTKEPTTMEITTMEQSTTTIEPNTMEPTTREPTTIEPTTTTREPMTVEPTTREPTTMEPTNIMSTTMEQTTTITSTSALTGSPRILSLTYNTTSGVVTCISTGGPANMVTWSRNGPSYHQSTIVVDTVSATYNNLLSIMSSKISDYTGNFTCTVSNNRGNSSMTTGEYKLLGVSGLKNTYAIGSPASFVCYSNFTVISIKWIRSSSDIAIKTNMIGSRELILSVEDVSKDVDGIMFTCEVIYMIPTGITSESRMMFTLHTKEETTPVEKQELAVQRSTQIIIGAVVGSLAAAVIIIILVLIIFLLITTRRKKSRDDSNDSTRMDNSKEEFQEYEPVETTKIGESHKEIASTSDDTNKELSDVSPDENVQ